MSELTFYTHPMSRGRVVRWMLEEVGIPYSVESREFGPEMKTPDYLAINPMGKVPAIKHGNTIVTEVAAICAYLADQFPDKELSPPPKSPNGVFTFDGCFSWQGLLKWLPVHRLMTGKLIAAMYRLLAVAVWKTSLTR